MLNTTFSQHYVYDRPDPCTTDYTACLEKLLLQFITGANALIRLMWSLLMWCCYYGVRNLLYDVCTGTNDTAVNTQVLPLYYLHGWEQIW